MIEINLLRNSGGGGNSIAGAGTNTSFTKTSAFGTGGGTTAVVSSKGMTIKLVILLMGPLGVIGYQYYNKYTLNEKLEQNNKVLNAKKEEAKSFGPKLLEVKKLEEEKAKLRAQVETIKKLSRDRLQGVKALDALQELIPQKTWFLTLKFIDKKVELTGYTLDDLEVSKLMQDMEESVHFAGVHLLSTKEVKTEKGVFKQFAIEGTLENM